VKKLLACALTLPILGQTVAQRCLSLLLPLPVIALTARLAQAKLFMNQEEALKKAFPGATRIERKTIFLTPEQVESIQQSSRTKLDPTIVTYYRGLRGEEIIGTAFFDTRVVRTMPMTFMTLINPDGTLGRVDVLSFYEPEDYLPREGWFALFRGRDASAGMRLRRDIPNVTGATLTCQAVTDGVRQTLALNTLL